MSRIRRFSLVAVLTTLLLALGLPSFAASPLSVNGSVTDPDGWLSHSDRSSVESATSKAASHGMNVSVVFVANLSGMDAQTWCQQTVQRSSLNAGTIVYVIAYSERHDAACVYNGTSPSVLQSAVRASEAQLSSKPLTSSDGARGVNAFVDTLVNANSSSPSR